MRTTGWRRSKHKGGKPRKPTKSAAVRKLKEEERIAARKKVKVQ